MITRRIFVQLLRDKEREKERKKDRRTEREERKKRRELRDAVYPTNPPAQNDAHQTQEWTTYRPLSTFQQATPLLPGTLVFRENHLSSAGLEKANTTQAPSFINET